MSQPESKRGNTARYESLWFEVPQRKHVCKYIYCELANSPEVAGTV